MELEFAGLPHLDSWQPVATPPLHSSLHSHSSPVPTFRIIISEHLNTVLLYLVPVGSTPRMGQDYGKKVDCNKNMEWYKPIKEKEHG